MTVQRFRSEKKAEYKSIIVCIGVGLNKCSSDGLLLGRQRSCEERGWEGWSLSGGKILFERENALSELFLTTTDFCEEAKRRHEVVPAVTNAKVG